MLTVIAFSKTFYIYHATVLFSTIKVAVLIAPKLYSANEIEVEQSAKAVWVFNRVTYVNLVVMKLKCFRFYLNTTREMEALIWTS